MSRTYYYYPRAAARIRAPLYGSTADKRRQQHGSETIDIIVPILSMTLEINSHLQADACDLTLDYTDAGVDPRLMRACTVEVYLYNQKDPAGDRTPLLAGQPIFTGISDKIERRGGEGNESVVTIRFLDWTTQFLRAKHYPTEGIPKYDETLPQIWAKICDHTGFYDPDQGKIVSSVEALRDELVVIGFDPNRPLSKSTTARIAKFGKTLPVKPGDSAWDIWQRVLQFHGLVGWIDRDKSIVAPTTEHFKSGQGPRFILGDNFVEWSESIDSSISDRGIHLVALDTVTGKLREAHYPPSGDPRIHIRRGIVKSKKLDLPDKEADQYDVFYMHDVTDQSALERIAQRTYDERCRQEIQGHIKTVEMSVEDTSGQDFDLLSLRAGDIVRVEFSADYAEQLRAKGDVGSRISYLTERGISDSTAALIAQNLDALPNLKPEYHVKQMRISYDGRGEMGRFEIDIYYHNKIQILGDSDDTN